MIKKITYSLLFFIALSTYSQNEKINNYKYVIVQDKFDFLKGSDKYQTSSLTKFLLKKKGFTVFLSNEELPNELITNRCLALFANVTQNSTLFSVKNKIELKDCYGNIIYTSKEGVSKAKDFKKSYHEAIRAAYSTMTDLNYNYEAKKETINTVDKVVIVDKVLPIKNTKPVVKSVIENNTKVETLYAQVKTNGFQLINTVPTIVFQVLETKVKDFFIIKDKNGMLYKNGDSWIAEYYENDKLIMKQFIIKF